jgi:hypothetical protein
VPTPLIIALDTNEATNSGALIDVSTLPVKYDKRNSSNNNANYR